MILIFPKVNIKINYNKYKELKKYLKVKKKDNKI